MANRKLDLKLDERVVQVIMSILRKVDPTGLLIGGEFQAAVQAALAAAQSAAQSAVDSASNTVNKEAK